MVINQMRDGDEPNVNQEWDDVEHEEPLQEQEVGEDTGAEPAAYLLHGTMPKL